MPTKQTTKPTRRSISTVQQEFAHATRHKAQLEASRERRLHNLIVERNLAEEQLNEAKKALAIAMAEDAATPEVAKTVEAIERLKEELVALYSPMLPATHRDQDGAGFQFRPSTKTVITDHEVLAKDLVDQGLWEAAGASLSVDPAKVSKILETIALPAISVEQHVIVAAYGPNKEK